jgi:hypothetical protein
MDKAAVIFVGFEIDEVIEQALADCREADRVFLENPSYLDRASADGRRYIGKSLGVSAGLDRIDDAARNVASLLGRISPSIRLNTSAVRLVAGKGEADPAAPEESEEEPAI